MADKVIYGPDGKPMFVSQAISVGPNGKPVFVGQDKPQENLLKRQEGSKITCPVCGKDVDYLVGETDTTTGEVQGCEACHKPARLPKKGGEGQNAGPKDARNPKETVFD